MQLLRKELRNALAAEGAYLESKRSSLQISAKTWIAWATLTVALVAATFVFVQRSSYDQAYAQGWYNRDARPHDKCELLNNLMNGERLRTSPAWRHIIQDRINTL